MCLQNRKVKKNLNYNIENLDLSNCGRLNQNCKYSLFAVNMHIGDTLLSGHYTSACKNANDGLWRYFSDNRVQTMYATITNEFLLKSAQGGTPYTLFYKGNPFNCLNASIEFNRMFQNRIY